MALSRSLGAPSRLALVGLLTVVAIVVTLVACGDGSGPEPGGARIIEVIDGDTVEVQIGARVETVRLLGIDTPETVKPGAPVDCFGPQASARTKELIPPGTEVRLARDEEVRDRFDRLLAYVTRAADDLFVNRSLVADGYARTLHIEPNGAFRAELAAAEAEARARGAGLWSACAAGPPS